MKAMNAEHANRWDSKTGRDGRGAQEMPRPREQRSIGRGTRVLGPRSRVVALFLFAAGFATYAFAADKQLKSVGLTVGDLGNPFFVQIAHGARDIGSEELG